VAAAAAVLDPAAVGAINPRAQPSPRATTG
jgi:hypothetical protein